MIPFVLRDQVYGPNRRRIGTGERLAIRGEMSKYDALDRYGGCRDRASPQEPGDEPEPQSADAAQQIGSAPSQSPRRQL
jgi:hypothetical protein